MRSATFEFYSYYIFPQAPIFHACITARHIVKFKLNMARVIILIVYFDMTPSIFYRYSGGNKAEIRLTKY